ncbi:MAG: nuclease-related domain-containing protein [bacterium]|nr:nuclease-related domain-containing protein [bacterium]
MQFLKKQAEKFDKKAEKILILIVLVSFLVGYFIGKNNSLDSLYGFFIAGIFLGIVSMLLVLQRDKFVKKSRDYSKGFQGEKYFKEFLDQNKSFCGFEYIDDIKLEYGNADFLIVNDNGVFCIEVKNTTGKITYDVKKDSLLCNFKLFDKDYLKQVKRNSVFIRNIIKEKINEFQYVHPVLVFSGLGSNLETGEKIGDVYVLRPEELLILLKQNINQKLNKELQGKIIKLMREYKESKR